MSQSTELTAVGIDAAPTVDEALAALTTAREPGASPRRLGWRRERPSSSSPTVPAFSAPKESAGPVAAGDATVVTAPAPSVDGASLDDAVAIEALGPYIARLMVDARQAAADYQRQTERDAAERAAEICAAAVADGEAIRARAMQEADAILDAARIQARSLAARVAEMASELNAGADVLAQPAAAAAIIDVTPDAEARAEVEAEALEDAAAAPVEGAATPTAADVAVEAAEGPSPSTEDPGDA